MTGIESELIWDIDIYLFVQKGKRVNISYISKRYSKAINKYIKSYDDKKPSKFITCLDANYLYRWAMSQWEIDKFCSNSIGENSSIGYILKADLEYVDELHELHNDYPLALEKLEISHNMLPNYCSSIAYKYGIKIGGVNKLVANLGNKSKYVFHYGNLQLYLSLVIKLTKVHRIMKFKQLD